MNLILAKIFRKKISLVFSKLANYFFKKQDEKVKIKIIKKGNNKNLYQIDEKIKLWLGGDSVIDQSLINSGVWEPQTTFTCKSDCQKK